MSRCMRLVVSSTFVAAVLAAGTYSTGPLKTPSPREANVCRHRSPAVNNVWPLSLFFISHSSLSCCACRAVEPPRLRQHSQVDSWCVSLLDHAASPTDGKREQLHSTASLNGFHLYSNQEHRLHSPPTTLCESLPRYQQRIHLRRCSRGWKWC